MKGLWHGILIGAASAGAVIVLGVWLGATPRPEGPYAAFELDRLREIAVQHDGRLKPLDTLARERVEFITGRRTYDHPDPLVTYLSMIFEGERWQSEPALRFRHPELVSMFGKQTLEGTLAHEVSWQDIVSNRLFHEHIGRLDPEKKGKTPLEKAILRLANQASLLPMLGQELKLVPPPEGFEKTEEAGALRRFEGEWFTVEDLPSYESSVTADLQTAFVKIATGFRGKDAELFNEGAREFEKRIARLPSDTRASGWRMGLESRFNLLRPFRLAAQWFYLPAVLVFLLHVFVPSRLTFVVGLVAMLAGFLTHLFGIVARSVIGEYFANSNMYESLTVVGAAAALCGLVFEGVFRRGFYGQAASLAAFMFLLIAESLYVEFRSIGTIQPVLATFWRYIHTNSMLVSYGAFAAAFALALNHVLVRVFQRAGGGKLADVLENAVYRVLQVGFVFLVAGTILGGVWAYQSWGRFWGWDPKETWALISILIYAIPLHARVFGFLRGVSFSVATMAGFAAIVFTYWGVNFVLVGLHSYASG